MVNMVSLGRGWRQKQSEKAEFFPNNCCPSLEKNISGDFKRFSSRDDRESDGSEVL